MGETMSTKQIRTASQTGFAHNLRFCARWMIFALIIGIAWPLAALAQGAAIGTLGSIIGKAVIVREGKSIPGKKGMEIFATDELQTEQRTAVKINFTDGGNFMAFEDSKVKISEYKFKAAGDKSSLKSAFDVAKGKVRFFVKPQPGRTNETNFKTSNAVMGIRGTSGFIDASNPNNTQLVVLTGKVEVSNPKFPGKTVTVPPNQMTSVAAGKAPTPPKVAPPALVAGLNANAEKVDPNVGKGEKQAHDDKEKSDKEKSDKKEEGKKEEGKKEEDKKEEGKKEEGKKEEGKKEEGKKEEPKKEDGKKEQAKEEKPSGDKKDEGSKSDGKKSDGDAKPAGADSGSKDSSSKNEPAAGKGQSANKETGASAGGSADASPASAGTASSKDQKPSAPAAAPVAPVEESKPVMIEKITVFSPEGKNTLSVKSDALNRMVTPPAVSSAGPGGVSTGATAQRREAAPPAPQITTIDVAKQVNSVVKSNTEKLEETKATQAAIAPPKPVATPSSVKVKIKVNLPAAPK